MADFIRRLVSGNRTRFKDAELDVELDLTYITDNVVVMGYPAAGVEGMYRNRREDARKFLDYRHGSNYWVFNFCPIRENSYDPNFFHGRVSRYPFPDHHAPPLAILALASREIALWLNGSPDRVAVLHCKAGKGRSGTLACAYLLSLDAQPSAPQLERNYSKKELAKFKIPLVPSASTHVEEKPAIETVDESQAKKDMAKERAEEFMNEMPADEAPAPAADTDTDEDATGASASTTSLPKSQSEVPNLQPKVSTDSQRTAEKAQADGVEAHDFAGETPKPGGESKVLSGPQVASPVPRSSNASPASSKTTSRLAAVLDFHTSRRIRPKSPSSSSSSSSSSDNEAESTSKPPEVSRPGPPPKQGRPQGVSISSQRRFLWYWSLVLADEAPKGFWPPLPYPPTSSEYDPKPQRASVRVLDAKVRMRDHNSMTASAVKTGSKLLGRFMDGKAKRDPADIWVSMARYDDDLVGVLERWERWGRETGIGGLGKRRVGGDQMPAVGSQDTSLRHEVREVFKGGEWDTKKMVRSFARLVAQEGKEVRSGKIITETLASRDDVAGVTIDANREVRFKIYMGKVFMAWMWLIPTFHLPDPSSPDAYEPVTLTFTKEDLDFPIGLGASLVDVQFTLQRVPANAPAATPPPRAQSSQDEGGGTGAVLGAVEGPAGLRERVNARQGLED